MSIVHLASTSLEEVQALKLYTENAGGQGPFLVPKAEAEARRGHSWC